jgi:hypothetical protein
MVWEGILPGISRQLLLEHDSFAVCEGLKRQETPRSGRSHVAKLAEASRSSSCRKGAGAGRAQGAPGHAGDAPARGGDCRPGRCRSWTRSAGLADSRRALHVVRQHALSELPQPALSVGVNDPANSNGAAGISGGPFVFCLFCNLPVRILHRAAPPQAQSEGIMNPRRSR